MSIGEGGNSWTTMASLVKCNSSKKKFFCASDRKFYRKH